QVAYRALLLHEVRAREELPRGVIDGCHQAQSRPALLEPVVPAAIPQDHLARLRPSVAATSMLGRAAPADSLDSALPKNPTHRRSGHVHAFLLDELLREVLVVEPGVLPRRSATTCERSASAVLWCGRRPVLPWTSAASPRRRTRLRMRFICRVERPS